MSPLPGADKYRVPQQNASSAGDGPWTHPLVVKANTAIPIADVLNTYFGMHVPADAEGWKVRCPLATEHDDGGTDRQFRVYASSNHGYCFALHGTLDPVGLWRLRSYFPTIRDAAEDLLTTFGVDFRPRPYRERMSRLRERAPFVADPASVVQAVNIFLAAQPDYAARQYEQIVLRVVNLILSEVHPVCDRAHDMEDIEAWLRDAKRRLLLVLNSTPPD